MAAACRSSTPIDQGRLAEARLKPQPDDEVPRFDYEAHVRDLVERRVWPKSTRRISELRIVIEYESARYLKRRLGRGRLNLDIVDYPGEWLLDLALLQKSYAEWSAEALALSREPHRAGVAAEWHAALAGVDPAGAGGRGERARGWPKPSPAISAPRAPTSTRSPCCRPAASSCPATWKARPR